MAKYTIIKGTILIDYVTTRNGENYPAIDHIARISVTYVTL